VSWTAIPPPFNFIGVTRRRFAIARTDASAFFNGYVPIVRYFGLLAPIETPLGR
jgi:hypothetical protein